MNPIDTLAYDNLFSGTNVLVVTQPGTILSGTGKVKRGTLLGKITATGKLIPCISSASDGSQNPYAVLLDTVADATSADAVCTTAQTGEFTYQAIAALLTSPDTPETFRAAMRALNMHMHFSIDVNGKD